MEADISAAHELALLMDDLSEWSQKTFGSDKVRGPVAPLKHLELEVKEAYEAYEISGNSQDFEKEVADCFLLLIDACRRANIPYHGLIRAAHSKLSENKKRKWAKPNKDGIIFHVKE